MICEIRKEISGLEITQRTLRNFGLLFCAVFVLWALIMFWKGSPVWKWPAAVSLGFLLSGILFPSALRQFYRLWMSLAFVLGWLMTRLILMTTFFLIMTPLGRSLRMVGKDLLDEKIRKEPGTCWKPHKQFGGPEQYKKQF